MIPCYNEAARLDRDAFLQFLASENDSRLVFVDDGSTDATNCVLCELVRREPARCTLLTLPTNTGKAEAVRQGMLAALREASTYAGFWDADLATPLDAARELSRVLDEREEVELVMGARVQLLGRCIDRSAWRHYLGRVCATLVSLTLDQSVYDTQCGAKLFRRSPATCELFSEPFSTKWLFDVELLARMLRIQRRSGVRSSSLGRVVVEYPLQSWRDVAGSKVGLWDVARTVPDLLRIWRRYRPRASAPAPSTSVQHTVNVAPDSAARADVRS